LLSCMSPLFQYGIPGCLQHMFKNVLQLVLFMTTEWSKQTSQQLSSLLLPRRNALASSLCEADSHHALVIKLALADHQFGFLETFTCGRCRATRNAKCIRQLTNTLRVGPVEPAHQPVLLLRDFFPPHRV